MKLFSKPLLMFFFFLLYACTLSAQPAYLLHKPFREQFSGTDSLFASVRERDSLKIISTLSEVEKWAFEENDKQLAYRMQVLKARYRMEVTADNTGLADFGIDDILKNIGNDMPELKAEALHAYSMYLVRNSNTAPRAFEYAFNAYDIYHHYKPEDFPEKSKFLYELAMNHTRYKDYAGSKELYLETLNARPYYRDPKEHNMLNGLAMCYRNMGVYDSAEYYFRKAYNTVEQKSDSLWIGILTGNIGITYYLQKRYDDAIPLLIKDVSLGITRKNIANTAKSMAILGDIYLELGDIAKGMQLLQQSMELIKKSNKWTDYELLHTVYPILAKAYAHNGNAAMAYAFMDSAIMVKDSIASQRNSLILLKTKQRLDKEKYAAEITRAEAQRSVNNVIRNSLMALILLLSVIAILFINRQRLKYNRRQDQLEAEKKLAESARQLAENEKFLAESELLNATVQLKDFTRTMKDKNELIEKFTEEIERYQSLPCSNELPNQNETLQQLQQSTILTEQQWDDFRNMFEKVHAGYLNRLRDKLPGLSPAEIRFVTLSKLKFSNKEMAGVLGISTDAVRMNKHRLKKKLNLTEEDDLDALVDAI